MKNGFAHLIIIFILALGALLFFSPIPSYNSGKANCLLIDTCPEAGISWKPSLYNRLTKQDNPLTSSNYIEVYESQDKCEDVFEGECRYYLCDIPLGEAYDKICKDGPGTGWYSSTLLDSFYSENAITSNTKTISDWKTYIEPDDKYTIKYPSEWQVVVATKNNNTSQTYNEILQSDEIQKTIFHEYQGSLGSFTVSIKNNPNGYTTQTWADNFFVPLYTSPGTNLATQQEDLTVDGQIAKQFSVFSFDRSYALVGIVHDGLIYMFNFDFENPNDPDFEVHKEQYREMLSSFKFTK